MLTEVQIRNIKGTDKVTVYPDMNGLYLRVSKTKKRWQCTVTKNGKTEHVYGGYYPETGLAQARAWAADIKLKGPPKKVEATDETTLEFFVNLYVKSRQDAKVSEATLTKYRHCINKYIQPIWSKHVSAYTHDDIGGVLKPINDAGHLARVREVLSLLHNAFARAKAKRLIALNPCDEQLILLTKRKPESHAAITDVMQFSQLLRDIDSTKAFFQARIAMQALPLVVSRVNELLDAQWTEFDFTNHIWNIPAERMKMRVPHKVPMSKQFEALILQLKPITGNEVFVFSYYRGQPFKDNVLRTQFNRLGYYGNKQNDAPTDAKFHSPHGFRASFNTILQEVLLVPKPYIEAQLAHGKNDPNGEAYDRASFLVQRVELMQLWADFVDVLKANQVDEINKFIKQHSGSLQPKEQRSGIYLVKTS